MEENGIHDLIIVGGGPAGLSASIYAMRAALKTVLIEKGVAGGQVNMSDAVENYPGFQLVTGPDLVEKLVQHAQSYGLEMPQQEVVSVEPGLDFHSVRLANGDLLHAHAVILAAGGSPRKLDIPGEDEYYGKGVSYCAVCDGFFFKENILVVVGGGDTAAEEALYLAKLAKKVYLIHRRDALRASMILQQRIQAESKIEIVWNAVLTAVKGNGQGVNLVDLQSTKMGARGELATDGVFIFIGFEPNNQLVPAGVKMNADGHVITDEKCESSIPGIYAIGDLREKYARQIVASAADGCTAALAAARYVETKKTSVGVRELPVDPWIYDPISGSSWLKFESL